MTDDSRKWEVAAAKAHTFADIAEQAAEFVGYNDTALSVQLHASAGGLRLYASRLRANQDVIDEYENGPQIA